MSDQAPKPSSAPKTPPPDSFPKLPQSIFNMEKRDGGSSNDTKRS